jgi:hypothetical protein
MSPSNCAAYLTVLAHKTTSRPRAPGRRLPSGLPWLASQPRGISSGHHRLGEPENRHVSDETMEANPIRLTPIVDLTEDFDGSGVTVAM